MQSAVSLQKCVSGIMGAEQSSSSYASDSIIRIIAELENFVS